MKSLLVKTNVKEASEEFIEELEKRTAENIKEAEKRANANNRRTLLARDL